MHQDRDLYIRVRDRYPGPLSDNYIYKDCNRVTRSRGCNIMERVNVFVGNEIEQRYWILEIASRINQISNTKGIGLDVYGSTIRQYRGEHKGQHCFPEHPVDH